ncbi:GntR family transcriptional regulator [Phycicoccus endophyticus]|nr:GntR family transcriptional regulator [Phycicoccus endophyticus]GGL34433.1 GntR family transcriptional regulator [Phycicoccus endophyticus]
MATSGFDDVLATLDAERRARRAVMSTSAERAARQVREEVVEGRLRSGTRLPEERLAAAIGVSRNTLREALSQLVAERILVRVPHRGVVVATPGPEDIRDLYAVRMLVEPAALAHGSGLSDRRVEGLRAAVDEGRAALAAGDLEGVGSANQHFHRAVVALAGSPRLDALMDLLLAEMRLVFHSMGDPAAFHTPYLEENARICDLLEADDREGAARHLAGYLARARDHLLSAPGSRTTADDPGSDAR